MYTFVKNDLIIHSSLTISLINNLNYLLDNSNSMSLRDINDALLSLKNQIEINSLSFNLILDKIDESESRL